MNVLLLTVFVGIVLVSFFVAFFLHQTARERGTNERDALLPLAEENPAPAPLALTSSVHRHQRNPPSP